jgi:hypothetical protein
VEPSSIKAIEPEIANEAMSFFFDAAQRQIVEEALSLVELDQEEKTRARRRAAGLAEIAGWFVANRTPMPGFGG